MTPTCAVTLKGLKNNSSLAGKKFRRGVWLYYLASGCEHSEHSHIEFTLAIHCKPISVVARSEALVAVDCLGTRIAASNPAQGLDIWGVGVAQSV